METHLKDWIDCLYMDSVRTLPLGVSLREPIGVWQVDAGSSVVPGMRVPREVHDQVIIFTCEKLECSYNKRAYVRLSCLTF